MNSKRKIRIKRKKSSSKNILLIVTLAILSLSLYILINSNGIVSFVFPKNLEGKFISSKSLGDIPLILPLTPTPTRIPTPTPVPLVGFCLNVPVLMYHHVQPQSQAVERGQTSLSVDNGVFDQQMAYLISSGYTTITAKTLVDALRNKNQPPSKSILVTLDDGYKDNFDYAYPVLQKYGVTANLLIPTGLLGGSDYLSWDQLKEMKNSGLIYLIDHSWSHYSVNYGSADKIKYEINTARQQLQDNTGQSVDIFGYPYGGFDDLSISVLKQEGFSGAFSTTPGHWQCDSFIMALHRTRIGNSPMAYYGF